MLEWIKSNNELRDRVQEYIDFIFSDEYHEDKQDDYEHPIFETVVVSYFGEDVWDKINEEIERKDKKMNNKKYTEEIKKIRKTMPQKIFEELSSVQPIEEEAWTGLWNLLKDGGRLVFKKRRK